MNIIRIKTDDNGARPPIQTISKNIPPNGYAICPEIFFNIFYSTNPAGFVNITVENNTVTAMTVNTEAYNAYLASLPEPEPEPDRDPTADEILNALLGVTE